jgi:hypothetical protein
MLAEEETLQEPCLLDTWMEIWFVEAEFASSIMSISPCWGQVEVEAVVQKAGQVPHVPPGCYTVNIYFISTR